MTPHPRLSVNQATIKHANLEQALDAVTAAGVASIGLWREPLHAVGLTRAADLVAASGLRVSSLCRGGFFTMREGAARRAALEENRRALNEAAAVGAPVLVVVAGGLPAGSRDLAGARARVGDAIAELAPYAASVGVTLAIEPLHPMYVSDRAVISSLAQALDIARGYDARTVGVVVDTFHVFWDPTVLTTIAAAGAHIVSYQVCDWATPLPADVLLARHQPGDGIIDFGPITEAVLAAGYSGDIEVEIFNDSIWRADADDTVAATVEAFARVIAPDLG